LHLDSTHGGRVTLIHLVIYGQPRELLRRHVAISITYGTCFLAHPHSTRTSAAGIPPVCRPCRRCITPERVRSGRRLLHRAWLGRRQSAIKRFRDSVPCDAQSQQLVLLF
jgi:hypothetical protein